MNPKPTQLKAQRILILAAERLVPIISGFSERLVAFELGQAERLIGERHNCADGVNPEKAEA